MALVLLSWIYILFTAVNFGFLFDRIVKLRVKDFSVISVLGLFLVTLVASAWAVFGRINWEFHTFLLIVNLLITIRYKTLLADLYTTLLTQLKLLTSGLKILLLIIMILIIAQCSAIPYVIDNESYYIQTIKWLNEYGFVKGLANLHPFLAQSSGWHITQSAFSFSFLYKNFNDLSGFCLLLGNLFAIQKLNDYFKNNNNTYLVIGFLPLANVFLFQFISAPSPDIPVYIISFMLFFYFIERYNTMDAETFNLVVVLVLFALYIKTTAVALLFIPMLLLLKGFRSLLPQIVKLSVIGMVVLVLFVVKNAIISGFPLFPIVSFHWFESDYRLPQRLAQSYYEDTKVYGYFTTQKRYEAMTALQLFLRWLTLPKLHGLFNKISIVLIVLSPVVIYRFFNRRAIWALYVIMCLQMAMLFVSSPQYRFFMNFLLLFAFFFAVLVARKKTFVMVLLYGATLVTAFVLLVPVNLNRFTTNKFVMATSNFSVNNAIFPYKNTKSDTGFELVTDGSLKYHSAIDNDFLWFAGDGDLPSVNKDQILLYKRRLHLVPQMRGTSISEGFYSMDIAEGK